MAALRFYAFCVSLATIGLVQQAISISLSEDKAFSKGWVAMVKSLSKECKTYILGSKWEPIGHLTLDQACSHMSSNSFKNITLEACSQDEYGTIVACICTNGSVDESVQHWSSIRLNDDKEFLRRWHALVQMLSLKCQSFTYSTRTDSIADLPHEKACLAVKSDSYKRSALEACSQDEYDAGLSLVCDVSLADKKVQHAGSIAVHRDQAFVKTLSAFVDTLSHECRSFVILVGTGPLSELPHDEVCRRVKSDSLKSSSLEVCSQVEYDKIVALVCGTRSSQSGSEGSSITLTDDKDFIKSWKALMESLSLECKRFVLYGDTRPEMDSTRDEACWRVESDEFLTRAPEMCSQDEYDALVKLVCHTASSQEALYSAYTVVFLTIILHFLIQ